MNKAFKTSRLVRAGSWRNLRNHRVRSYGHGSSSVTPATLLKFRPKPLRFAKEHACTYAAFITSRRFPSHRSTRGLQLGPGCSRKLVAGRTLQLQPIPFQSRGMTPNRSWAHKKKQKTTKELKKRKRNCPWPLSRDFYSGSASAQRGLRLESNQLVHVSDFYRSRASSQRLSGASLPLGDDHGEGRCGWRNNNFRVRMNALLTPALLPHPPPLGAPRVPDG